MLKEYKNNQIPLITLMLVLSIAATKKKKKKIAIFWQLQMQTFLRTAQQIGKEQSNP